LVINVENDLRFERKGNDIYTDTQIDLYTAVLGGDAVVTTFNEKLVLKVPAGTQPGQLIRLTGKGMPVLNKAGKRGDLYARIRVQIPKNITEKQKKLFEEARISG
jgi:curved DNA-binding protein